MNNYLDKNNAVELHNKQLFEYLDSNSNLASIENILEKFVLNLDIHHALAICATLLPESSRGWHNLNYIRTVALCTGINPISSVEKSNVSPKTLEVIIWLMQIQGNQQSASNLCVEIIKSRSSDDATFKFCISQLLKYRLRDTSMLEDLAPYLTKINYTSLDGAMRAISLCCRINKVDEAFTLIKRYNNSNSNISIQDAFAPYFGKQSRKLTSCNSFNTITEDNYKPGRSNSLEIITIVWGARFIKYFNDICIANLVLTDGWRRLLNSYRVVWTIYTTEESVPHLHSLNSLAQQANLSVRYNSSIIKSDDMGFLRRGLAIEDALLRNVNTGTVVYLLSPDSIIGEGLDRLVDLCPDIGASGLSCLRVFDQPVIDAANCGLLSNIAKDSSTYNSKLVALALSDWSHYWTRKTYLDSRWISPTRRLIKSDTSKLDLYNGEACAYALRLNSDSLDELLLNATWINSWYYDRFYNMLDHYIIWEWSGSSKLKLISDTDDFFFCDLVGSGGFTRTLKSRHGYPSELYANALMHKQTLNYTEGAKWLFTQPLHNNGFDYRVNL